MSRIKDWYKKNIEHPFKVNYENAKEWGQKQIDRFLPFRQEEKRYKQQQAQQQALMQDAQSMQNQALQQQQQAIQQQQQALAADKEFKDRIHGLIGNLYKPLYSPYLGSIGESARYYNQAMNKLFSTPDTIYNQQVSSIQRGAENQRRAVESAMARRGMSNTGIALDQIAGTVADTSRAMSNALAGKAQRQLSAALQGAELSNARHTQLYNQLADLLNKDVALGSGAALHSNVGNALSGYGNAMARYGNNLADYGQIAGALSDRDASRLAQLGALATQTFMGKGNAPNPFMPQIPFATPPIFGGGLGGVANAALGLAGGMNPLLGLLGAIF